MLPRLWLLVGSDRPTDRPTDRQCHLLSCPGQLKNDNPFRYLQTLHSISAEKNSTIIFPLPMELLGGFNEAQVRVRMIFMRTRWSTKNVYLLLLSGLCKDREWFENRKQKYLEHFQHRNFCSQGLRKRANVNASEDWANLNTWRPLHSCTAPLL